MPRTSKRALFFKFPEYKFECVFFSLACCMPYPSHFRWVVAGNSLADSINVPSLRYKALKANDELKSLLHSEWIIEHKESFIYFLDFLDEGSAQSKVHAYREEHKSINYVAILGWLHSQRLSGHSMKQDSRVPFAPRAPCCGKYKLHIDCFIIYMFFICLRFI
jgi:hypothetical protein